MNPEQIAAGLTVTQEDREAVKRHQQRYLTEGVSETELLTQAFARHRIAQSKADAARIAALEEALEPFAEAANNLDDEPDGAELWEHPAAIVLTAGDLRKAAAALAKAGAA